MQLVPDRLREPLSNFNPTFKFSFYDTESLRAFFRAFRLKCYILLLLSPIGMAASAYVAQVSVGTGSVGTSIGLILLSLLLLLPWTLVPVLFVFTTSQPKTWQRKLSWVYVVLLIAAYVYWLTFF